MCNCLAFNFCGCSWFAAYWELLQRVLFFCFSVAYIPSSFGCKMWLFQNTSNRPIWAVTKVFILITWGGMLHAGLALRKPHLTYISQPALSEAVYTSQISKNRKMFKFTLQCCQSWPVYDALPLWHSLFHDPCSGQHQTASTPSFHKVSAQQAFILSDIPSPHVEKLKLKNH